MIGRELSLDIFEIRESSIKRQLKFLFVLKSLSFDFFVQKNPSYRLIAYSQAFLQDFWNQSCKRIVQMSVNISFFEMIMLIILIRVGRSFNNLAG